MSFEFNEEAFEQLAKQAVEARAQQVQTLLDSLRASQKGKAVDEVKATLMARWKVEFDRTPTDPHLTAWAEQLARGGRVVVKTVDA